MDPSKQTVALAGAGDLAKYLVEELQESHYNIVVLSRASRPWFNRPGVSLHITDYTKDSILPILNTTNSTILFSFLHSNDPSFYVTAHEAMLEACKESTACKRFVPSEYGGNIDDFPLLPRFYEPTHVAFRRILSQQEEIEWTLVNNGWFMDYFIQPADGSKSHMKALPGFWPIDLDTWTATVLGTGNEKISWTAARDVAKALVRLVAVARGEWERHIYVAGETGTWNQALEKVEKFHGRRLKNDEGGEERKYKSIESINENLQKHANDEEDPPFQLWIAYMDEWNVSTASAVPWNAVKEQRERFFSGVKFRTIDELLEDSKEMEIV